MLTLALTVASACILFLLLRLSPSSPSPKSHQRLRLRLRSSALERAACQILVNPVIVNLERHLEDREWEHVVAAGLHEPGMAAAPVPHDLTDAHGEADKGYINDAV